MTERKIKDRLTHARRGGDYTFLGIATLQTEPRTFNDYDPLSIYLSKDGLLCARSPEEFDDGRFEPLHNPPKDAAEAAVDSIRRIVAGTREAVIEGDMDPIKAFDFIQDALKSLDMFAQSGVCLSQNALLHGKAAFEQVDAQRKASMN